MESKLENSLIFAVDNNVAVIHLGAALVDLDLLNEPVRHHELQTLLYLTLHFSEHDPVVGELQLSAALFFIRLLALVGTLYKFTW